MLWLYFGGASLNITLKAYNSFKKEDYAVYNSSVSSISSEDENNSETTVQTISTDTSKTNVSEDATKKSDKTNTNAVKTIATVSKTKNTVKTPVVKVEPLKFERPLEGEIIKKFSMDNVIFSKTLETWKVNDGASISAAIGSKVKSIERGTIEKIYSDAFYGKSILIDHGQGYKSIYSNLDENVLVKEKQTVKKGSVIGNVGKTSIGEIKEDSHLRLQLLHDSKAIDPFSIIL